MSSSSLAAVHPLGAFNLARLILLIPGYAIELGFYLIVLLIYLVPAWRGRTTPHTCATLPAIHRSSHDSIHDFYAVLGVNNLMISV